MAWTDIFGQAFAKQLFQSHLASGQVPNAYLLAGPDGVGKRRLAIEMAKALNCSLRGTTPCDACACCSQMSRLVHPDLHVMLPGGASDQLKVADIRQLLGRLALRPFSANLQVAVIVGAERLTEEAANSLLKMLEEPTAHARFLLTTSRLSDCLPTIVSRCQLIRCEPLPDDVVARILVDAQGCVPRVAEVIARLSRGSASYAIDLAGRWEAYGRILARLADGGVSDWLTLPLPETRQEVAGLLEQMMGWLRDVAVTASGGSRWAAHAGQEGALRRQAGDVDLDRCLETVFGLVALRESLDQFVSPRLVATLARERWLGLFDAPVHRRPSAVHREAE